MAQALFLKPQQLGLQDRPYKLTDAYSAVKQAIDKTSAWNKWKELKVTPNPYVKMYLNYLLDAAIAKGPKADHIDKIVESIDPHDIHAIHNDFGEIIGPMNILTYPQKYFTSLKLSKNDSIHWPLRSNEPLMDFKIHKNVVEYKFSSKAGTTTNTVKPNDIVGLVDSNPKLKKKWGQTAEYAVLRTLMEKPMWTGPFYALLEYNTRSYHKINISVADIKAKISLVSSAPVSSMPAKTKTKVIENLIEAEKKLADLSKTSLNYTDMFYDAVAGSIFYINWLKTDSTHLPIFHTAGEVDSVVKDKTRKKVVFRPQNSPGHVKSKLGLQM